jgi:hypothetical protein
MPGQPLRSLFPHAGLCQALNNRRQPCGCRMVKRTKNGRLLCRFHGGAATGPKTVEGRRRSGENLRRWWAARRGTAPA